MALECALRQPYRAKQLGLAVEPEPVRVGARVQRVTAGDHGDDAAGSHQVDALGDGPVVDRERGVSHLAGVSHLDVAEGQVADRHVVEPVRQACALQRLDLRSQIGAGKSGAKDGARDGVLLDGCDLADLRQRRRHACQEKAGARHGLDDRAALEAHAPQRLPHGADQHRIGVEGVGDGAARAVELLFGQQALEVVAVGAPRVLGVLLEQPCQSAPARVAQELVALRVVRDRPGSQQFLGQLDGLEVVADALFLAFRRGVAAVVEHRPGLDRSGLVRLGEHVDEVVEALELDVLVAEDITHGLWRNHDRVVAGEQLDGDLCGCKRHHGRRRRRHGRGQRQGCAGRAVGIRLESGQPGVGAGGGSGRRSMRSVP